MSELWSHKSEQSCLLLYSENAKQT